jgi:phosphoglycerol geranylgeranyltransferase
MGPVFDEWTHVVKLDPDKDLLPGDTYAEVCSTGTDAIMIGGTTRVTPEKIAAVLDGYQDCGIPLYQEPNDPAVVVDSDQLAGFLIPIVLNAGDVFWIVGAHREGVKRYPDHAWDRTIPEAYIVLNPDAAVTEYTSADADLTAEDVAGLAVVAERFFSQPIVYLEYSGTFGDPATVGAARDALEQSTLFYGGGIHDFESARTMAERADVIVVGNLLYEEGVEAVRETVCGAADVQE